MKVRKHGSLTLGSCLPMRPGNGLRNVGLAVDITCHCHLDFGVRVGVLLVHLVQHELDHDQRQGYHSTARRQGSNE